MIKFTANYDDLSTDRGYQFKFHCDKCGNGYMSRFQPSLTGTAGGVAGMLSNLITGPVVDRYSFTPVFVATALVYPAAWLVLRSQSTALRTQGASQ